MSEQNHFSSHPPSHPLTDRVDGVIAVKSSSIPIVCFESGGELIMSTGDYPYQEPNLKEKPLRERLYYKLSIPFYFEIGGTFFLFPEITFSELEFAFDFLYIHIGWRRKLKEVKK